MWITISSSMNYYITDFRNNLIAMATSCISSTHCGIGGEGWQLFEITDKENVNQ